MTPRKKTTGAEYIMCLVRNDRPNSKVAWLTDVLVFGQSVDELQKMVDEDRYGLLARGFEPSGIFRLTPVAGGKWRLPTCGAYESVQNIYLDKCSAVGYNGDGGESC